MQMNFKKKKRWHALSGQPLTDLDKQVMYWENKGKLVPTRELIKTPEQIEGIRKSGVVNTGVLDEVAKQIHEGMNTQEIDDICMKYCEEHHAIPACLNYEGFPKSVCTSINEVVCHGIPKKEDVLKRLSKSWNITAKCVKKRLSHELDHIIITLWSVVICQRYHFTIA